MPRLRTPWILSDSFGFLLISARHTSRAHKPRTLRTRVSLAEALLAMRGGDGLAEGLMAAEAAEILLACEAGQGAVLGEAHPEYQRTRELVAAARAAGSAGARVVGGSRRQKTY